MAFEAAAQGPALEPWQRESIQRFGRGAEGAELLDPSHPGASEFFGASTDGEWSLFFPPTQRLGHTAIYDPARDRMIVFGGWDGLGFHNDVWALPFDGTPGWTELKPSSQAPSGRFDATAVYDPARYRMIVFGGLNSSFATLNDVWVLSLAGVPVWTQLIPAGTPPGVRASHTAVYDPARDRMVVFGGRDGSRYLTDVWSLALGTSPEWMQLMPAGTPPRGSFNPSAVYDPVRDRIVVFGGQDGAPNSDLWALSLGGAPVWTQLAAAGVLPSGRWGHTANYDPVRDRIIVFGGVGDGNLLLGDTWELSLAISPAWTQLAPAGAPPTRRRDHASVYDPVRDRTVVFGGWDGNLRRDVWTLSLAGPPVWTPITPGGDPPAGRYGHTVIYDAARERMIVYGGVGERGDVWALSLAGSPAWTQLLPTGTPPAGHYIHTAVYDAPRERMIIFGGWDGAYSNDVWALSLAGSPAWTRVTPAGTLPPARYGHSAIYDPLRERMIVFGGYDGSCCPNYFNDVWALSLSGPPAWSQVLPRGLPPRERWGHAAIYDPARDRMVVFGGSVNEFPSGINDLWALSLATPEWANLYPAYPPILPRYWFSSIHDPVRDRMVVFAGTDDLRQLGDLWALSLADPPTWTLLAPAGVPPIARVGHTAVYDPQRDRMVIFGGFTSSNSDEAWGLSWAVATGIAVPVFTAEASSQ